MAGPVGQKVKQMINNINQSKDLIQAYLNSIRESKIVLLHSANGN